MAIRVSLECGHTSVLRTRTTPEGYTHDWEVFVKGVNNADVHHFIEKVVFLLHETFPKPKRTVKSPPYTVKESGYAGFVMPIHVYLRNKDEPKKFIIQYDLHLQQSGPAINAVIRHNEIFSNPSDEFRKLLLKGGATPVHNMEGSSDKFESKLSLPMTGKPKLSGAETKKHRPAESRPMSTFQSLFGTPIKTGKISPDNNKKMSSEKSVANKTSLPEKSDKSEKSQKTKHSQHKEVVKDKTSDDRKEKKDKDKESSKDKDKEKTKDRHKRALSPISKTLSPKMKRTVSPSPVRKPPSPKRSSSPKLREKESKKEPEKERDKDKQSKEVSRISSEDSKSDRKKDKKRHKEDREKEKKDKHKEKERDRSKESSKNSESKKLIEKSAEKTDKVKIEKSSEIKTVVKEEKKSPKAEKSKEEKAPKLEKTDKPEKTEKRESKGNDKEKQQKHKHKKKDKKEKRDSSKDHERKEKKDKSKNSEKPTNSNPLSTLLAEMPGDESDSRSAEEDSFVESKTNFSNAKKEVEEVPPPETARTSDEVPAVDNFVKKEKSERHRRDKSAKLNRSEERENRKKKRKSAEVKLEEEVREVKREKVRENSSSPPLEPVSSSQSPVVTENDRIKDVYKEHVAQKELNEQEQVTPDSTNSALVDIEHFESLGFTEEYLTQLKDLQHKIMTIQDDGELQRVVAVIAETGQYEITKKTFDFDLCALDKRTVQRLQKFFSGS